MPTPLDGFHPLPMRILLAAALYGLAACGGSSSNDNPGPPTSDVAVRYSSTDPEAAPFPSDRYTVEDARQMSTRRVALPTSDCAVRVSDCQDIEELNTLDGFSVTPRFTIPFTGDIDPTTVTSDTVYLVRVGGSGDRTLHERSGINQVAWDPPSRTLSFKSDELLREQARYLMVVTSGVKDTAGRSLGIGEWNEASSGLPVGSAPESGSYREALRQALTLLPASAAKPVAASLFTTQTATAELARMVGQVMARTATGMDFAIGSDDGAPVRAVFDVAGLSGGVFRSQTGVAPAFTDSNLPLSALQQVQGAVAQVAYGRFDSPSFMTSAAVPRIVPIGTAQTAWVVREEALTAQIFVPSGTRPANGWPVVIFGHGFGNNIYGAPWQIASILASHGLATASIHVVGHGGGDQGVVRMSTSDARVVSFAAGGRGVDQNGDGQIAATEGSTAAAPYGVLGARDALRQTVVDLAELARRFRSGVDVDGDSRPDFDGTRVMYAGQSFGGVYGVMLLATEPLLVAGVPNVGGGSLIEATRNGAFRVLRMASLAARSPSLINLPPINGVAQWDDNQPLRNQPPLTTHVDGALAIAKAFDNSEWAQQGGTGTAYAPLLRLRPLTGHTAKPVILQYAKGDGVMSNPSSSMVVRGGDLADRVSFYRHDLAMAADPALGRDPHGYLLNRAAAASAPYAIAAQHQIGEFLSSGGVSFNDADGSQPYFETGVDTRILDQLNF